MSVSVSDRNGRGRGRAGTERAGSERAEDVVEDPEFLRRRIRLAVGARDLVHEILAPPSEPTVEPTTLPAVSRAALLPDREPSELS